MGDLVGEVRTSNPLTIDQEHLSMFAKASYLEDEYVDLTTSRNNALGPELVDGFLLLSLLVHFSFDKPFIQVEGAYGFNYGLDRVRFTKPVMVGETVTVTRTVIDARAVGDTRARVVEHVVMTKEGETDPVMVADWVMLYVDRLAEEAAAATGPAEAEQ
ncbi:MaoC/PaaZ C-terminal domain-containing protein [Corynebacterium freneyi]|uniref:MaoC/PaaZ C-terminal domain-containing protein n=1 Tax=Corynebacterium freneyi TaxID=134034 RepID=UPI001EF35B82|nr:hypothetical protein [Corynebacterium freneyi]